MEKHYFEAEDYELAKAMLSEYTLEVDDDEWDARNTAVLSFDIEDAVFDPDLFNSFDLNANGRKTLSEEGYYRTGIDAETLKDEFEIDVNDFGNWSEIVVLNNLEYHGGPQTCIEWGRIYPGIYVAEEDYKEFMENHPEWQTKEYKIKKVLAVMNEYGITVDDLTE